MKLADIFEKSLSWDTYYPICEIRDFKHIAHLRHLSEAATPSTKHSRAAQVLRAVLHLHESFQTDVDFMNRSVFLYSSDGLNAAHAILENQSLHITWIGSRDKRGKELLEKLLAWGRSKQAHTATVEPIWESQRFYQKNKFSPLGDNKTFVRSLLQENAEVLDRNELEDLLSAVEYEQEEVNNASYSDDADDAKLDKDYKALEAVAMVIKNNQIALDKEPLMRDSIFLYNYRESGANFAVAAVQIWLEKGVAHVKWLGSYGLPPGSGRALLLAGLEQAKQRGATRTSVESKWASEGFYQKLGYDVTHRGEVNPFSGSALVRMARKLEEGWTEEDQLMVHTNPTAQELKNLARNSRYHSARFVIYKDGTVKAADSEHYTHHSAAPAMGAWAIRGFVQWMGGKDYAYRSMEVYSPKSVDHPIFRVWERAGIGNGNPEVVEEAWTKNYKRSINRRKPKVFSQSAHCAARPKRQVGEKTSGSSVNENASLRPIKTPVDEIEIIPQQEFGQDHILQVLHRATQQSDTILGLEIYVYDENHTRLVAAWDDKNKQLASAAIFEHQPQLRQRLYVGKNVETYPGYRNQKLAGRLYKYCKETLGMTIQCDMSQTIGSKTLWTKTLPSLGLHPKVLDSQTSKTFDAGVIDPYQNNNLRYCWILESNDKYPNHLCENSLVQPYRNIYVAQEALWEITHQVKPSNLVDLLRQQANESWTNKYKKSINCDAPKGFSQRAHCAGRKKRQAGGETSSKSVSENTQNQEIHNYPKLDRILLKLCDLVDSRRAQDSHKYGWVGAALLDPQNRATTGVSTRHNNKWSHAERGAMMAYRKKYGAIPDGCIIITTCSPCSERMPARQGASCTDLINSSPVKKVYCGFDDVTQPAHQRTFNMIETSDPELRQRCQKYAEQFMDWETEQRSENFADGRDHRQPLYDSVLQHLVAEAFDQHLTEDLRTWFKQKWVRFGPDGKIRGACARGSEGEGKPKCLPQQKAWALGKKKRATAARRKRREDPNPRREGKAKNVATKESQNCPHCGGEMVDHSMLSEKRDACYYKVKSRYKVWPSAYASGALVQCRKKGARNWGNKGKT
jgi:pyrimidine deaminase RibD-like protein/GNAT superfamily N-acetyltransferase